MNSSHRSHIAGALGLCATLLASGCSEPDPQLAHLCGRVVWGLEAKDSRIELLNNKRDERNENAVTVNYRVNGAGPFWLACQFADGEVEDQPPRLWALTSDRWGQIPDVKVFLLQRFWLAGKEPDRPQ